MSESNHKAGFHTESEIRSQPRRWAESLRQLREDPEVEKVIKEFRSDRWIFIGCGSSYYLGLAAAASWTALTGIRAQAFPASELLLYPRLVLESGENFTPVLISRSGTTSEVLKAGELLKERGIPFVAVTCTGGSDLERMADASLSLAAADEASTVMTLSFTSMLLAIQYLAGKQAGDTQFINALLATPRKFDQLVERSAAEVKGFVESHEFEDYVWLGQGPHYGLACEGALKVMEMSCSYAQSFHTLEFRHGPKSIVSPETLIMFQMSQSGLGPETDVLEEVKDLGGKTLVVADEANERIRRNADLLVEQHLGGNEYAGLAARVPPAQLVGLYAGLKKGLDPDSPRHLSRVVILEDRT